MEHSSLWFWALEGRANDTPWDADEDILWEIESGNVPPLEPGPLDEPMNERAVVYQWINSLLKAA